jgi:hypothetical protein
MEKIKARRRMQVRAPRLWQILAFQQPIEGNSVIITSLKKTLKIVDNSSFTFL